MKKLKYLIISFIMTFSCLTTVNAGTATNSGTGYSITATATASYISCVATGKLSNGSTAQVTGYKATTYGTEKVGTRSGSSRVYWYISEVSGASRWSYCSGAAKLSDGLWYYTTTSHV